MAEAVFPAYLLVRAVPVQREVGGKFPDEIDSHSSADLCVVWLSGKKKEPKPKLFGPDIFGWGGGFPREGVGAKKFGMSFETQG